MTDGPANDAARLRGKRVALVVVIAVAVTFIGASAVQIIPAVFGAGTRPIPAGPPGSSARVCAEGVAGLLRAMGDDGAEAPADDAWARAEAACRQSPEGLDAWAALLRWRATRAQLGGQPCGTGSTGRGSDHARARLDDPLRHEVAEHLPADLR
jgi:hypothetical protein